MFMPLHLLINLHQESFSILYFFFHPPVGVLDRQPTKGVPEVDECGFAKIGNSKEETRATQFRQVRVARCVIPYVLYAV
jgi:hypothetical protein